MNTPIKCETLFQRIQELEQEYITFWADICRIDSPTEYKEGVDRVGEFVMNKARERGWQIEVQKQPVSGNCICITMNPQVKERPVCFSSHMDTVHPIGLFGPEPVHMDEEKIYGPGVADCKGGIAAAFLAMAALDDIGFRGRPVKLLLQSDEENSSRFSNKSTVDFICRKSENCVAFLNGEGALKGTAVITRKGICRYLFEITGETVHSAICHQGSSAICEAAYKIIELEKLKNEKGLTCNCGLISGGTAENTVPKKCSFTADIRFANEEELREAQKLVSEVAATSYVKGTTCIVTLKSSRVAMERTKRNEELLQKLNEIFEANGLDTIQAIHSNGGSDAAEVTAYGLPCLDAMGVIGGASHDRAEWAYLWSLVYSAKMHAAAAYCL
ncbi:MAG: M20/M25/M40 family metallo-hydrolase [Lachnospiraceae bacterium]|nr:M20/M25/M40 family metallo-hydrolase [Lachnospiraceae bacterium]